MVENYRHMLATLGPDEKIEIVTHSMGAAYAEGMIEYFQENAKDIASRITTVVHLSPADAIDIEIAAKTSYIKRMQLMTAGDNTLYWADWWTSEINRIIPGIDISGFFHWSVWVHQSKYANYMKNKGKQPDYDAHADTKNDPRTFTIWLPELERAAKVVGQGFDGAFIGKIHFDRLITSLKKSIISSGSSTSGGSPSDDYCEDE
ncbi:hypothetical protein D3C86_1473250 [compost metagenome]